MRDSLVKTDGFAKIAFYALAGLFAVFLILAMTSSFSTGILPGFLAAAAVIALTGLSGRLSKRTAVICCVLFCVLPRLFIVLFTRMELGYDFGRYYDTAFAMAYGAPVREQAYQALFPHLLGYPAALTVVFRIFGDSLGTAQAFNIVLDAASCLLMFHLGSKRLGERAGTLAALLYAFNPNAILHMPISCGEPLYMLLMLVSIALFERLAAGREDGRWYTRLPGWLLLGLSVGLFSAVRPLGPVLLIAFCACRLVFGKAGFLKKLLPLALMLAAYLAASALYFAWTELVLDRPVAKGAAGWNLYVGMNAGADGRWTAGDYAVLTEKLGRGMSAPEAQADFMELALGRVRDNFGSGKMWSLIAAKFQQIWGRDNAMTYWVWELEDESVKPDRGDFILDVDHWKDVMDAACGVYWWALLLLCAPAVYFMFGRGASPGAVLTCIVLLIGIVLSLLALEANARYHYPVDALLALIAGWGCGELLESVKVSPAKSSRAGKGRRRT